MQRCNERGEVVKGDSSGSECPVFVAVKVAAVIIQRECLVTMVQRLSSLWGVSMAMFLAILISAWCTNLVFKPPTESVNYSSLPIKTFSVFYLKKKKEEEEARLDGKELEVTY